MALSFRETLAQALPLIEAVLSGKRRQPPWWAQIGARYDSPLERDFAWHAVKYLRDDVAIRQQVWASTCVGNFRMDFVLELNGRRVGVECDGRDYHQDGAKDRARDLAIVAAGAADVVYRVRGQDAFWNIEDVLYLIAMFEPDYFSERGDRNLAHAATRRARQFAEISPEAVVVRYEWDEYDNGPEEDMPADFQVHELRLAIHGAPRG